MNAAAPTITVFGVTYTEQAARERVAELTAQNTAWGPSGDRCTQLASFADQGITPQTPKPQHDHDRRDLYQAPDGTGKTHYAGILHEFACGADARTSRTQAARHIGRGHATCQRCQTIADREDHQ